MHMFGIMSDMKFTWGESNNRLILSVILGVLLFIAGVHYGYNNRPEIDKVVGVVHTSENASNTPMALETCIDAKGAEVSCLLSRDDVKAKSAEAADFNQFWKVWNI